MVIQEILSHLTEHEIQEISYLLETGALGNSKGIFQLFSAVLAIRTENKHWTEIDLARKLFPADPALQKRNYIQVRLSNLVNFLNKFLGMKAFLSDKQMMDYCILKELQQRKMNRLFSLNYSRITKKSKNSFVGNFTYYVGQVELRELNLLNSIEDMDSLTRSHQASLDAIDRAYVLKKLSLVCKALSQDGHTDQKHEIKFIQEITRWVNDTDLGKDEMIRLYHDLYCLLSAPSGKNEKIYVGSRDAIMKLIPELRKVEPSELEDLFAYLINYCVWQYNNKQPEYRNEIISLYTCMLEEEIIFENGLIPPRNFMNVVFCYLFIGAQNEMKAFINDYGSRIGGKAAQSVLHFGQGYANFFNHLYDNADEDFSRALTMLPPNLDLQLEAEIRAMQCRAKFMKGEYPETQYLVQSLVRFINGQRTLSESKSNSFKIFSDYMLDLCKAYKGRENFKKKTLTALGNRIAEDKTSFFASQWITKLILKAK